MHTLPHIRCVNAAAALWPRSLTTSGRRLRQSSEDQVKHETPSWFWVCVGVAVVLLTIVTLVGGVAAAVMAG
jgi:hypothetical protein